MRIGIIGFGLIGGSIAKALKKTHSENSVIVGYDLNPEFTKAAFEEGVIDRCAKEIGEDFRNCNVVFICTPIGEITSTVQKLIPFVSSDCILTDIGSTKYDVVESLSTLLSNHPKKLYFVGGHPMAGSEKSGYFASSAHLFENAYYVLTPAVDTPEFILFILQKLIERLGAIPMTLPASYHDFATAVVSHFPHIVASSLVHLVKESDGSNNYLHTLAAGGFKDLTRIASSNATIWQHICLSNKVQIQKVFKHYQILLNNFMDKLEKEDHEALYDFFETGKIYRDTFNEGRSHDLNKTFTLYVDAKDEPGIIASIATLLSSHSINIKDIGIINHREFDPGVLRICVESQKDRLTASQLLSKHSYTIYY
jgi:prephenate dehydrogenase